MPISPTATCPHPAHLGVNKITSIGSEPTGISKPSLTVSVSPLVLPILVLVGASYAAPFIAFSQLSFQKFPMGSEQASLQSAVLKQAWKNGIVSSNSRALLNHAQAALCPYPNVASTPNPSLYYKRETLYALLSRGASH